VLIATGQCCGYRERAVKSDRWLAFTPNDSDFAIVRLFCLLLASVAAFFKRHIETLFGDTCPSRINYMGQI